MARPAWRGSEEQKKLLAAAGKAVQRAEAAENDAWKAIQAAREGGVPDTQISSGTGVPRSTLIRRLGPRESETGPASK